MIGIVSMADRSTARIGRFGAWAALLVLLVGVGLALASPSPRPMDDQAAVLSAELPVGGAKLPHPQARADNLLLAADDPSERWWPSSPSSPDTDGLVPALPGHTVAGRRAARRPGPALAFDRPALRLAYDSQGPPFVVD